MIKKKKKKKWNKWRLFYYWQENKLKSSWNGFWTLRRIIINISTFVNLDVIGYEIIGHNVVVEFIAVIHHFYGLRIFTNKIFLIIRVCLWDFKEKSVSIK